MATIKNVIQNFCYRLNLTAPTAFVGVSSPAEQQYLSLFQFIGDNLRNRPYQWPQLKRGYTFTTTTDVSTYQLPGDFYRILDSTQWDTTNQFPVRGPISDYAFAAREFAVIGVSTLKAYRIIGPTGYLYSASPYSKRSAGVFNISPAGENDTDELYLGYVSCNWIWPQSWVTGTVYAAGAIRAGNGYVYRTAAGGTSGATRPSHSTGSASDGGVTWTVYTEPYPCEASNTALSDNDECLFDSDLMIQGMDWAYKRVKGQDFQSQRADWEQELKSAFARFNGPTRVNMADQISGYDELWPNVPLGNWSD